MSAGVHLRICLLFAALAVGTAGCFSIFGSSEDDQPRPWEITLQSGNTTNVVPRQEWLVIENDLLGSDRFQRFVETAQRGSTWTAPVGNRTYRWMIHDYDPIDRRVIVKRFLGE